MAVAVAYPTACTVLRRSPLRMAVTARNTGNVTYGAAHQPQSDSVSKCPTVICSRHHARAFSKTCAGPSDSCMTVMAYPAISPAMMLFLIVWFIADSCPLRRGRRIRRTAVGACADGGVRFSGWIRAVRSWRTCRASWPNLGRRSDTPWKPGHMSGICRTPVVTVACVSCSMFESFHETLEVDIVFE